MGATAKQTGKEFVIRQVSTKSGALATMSDHTSPTKKDNSDKRQPPPRCTVLNSSIELGKTVDGLLSLSSGLPTALT